MIGDQPGDSNNQNELIAAPPAVAQDTSEKKAAARAIRAADRRLKEGDRLAKLHVDGDKLLLRWLRVSLVLVTTGIGIERGLQFLEQARTGPSLDPYAVLRLVGLALVLIGVGALGVASLHHRQRLRAITAGGSPPVPKIQLSLIVSVAVVALIVIAFLSIVSSYADGLLVIAPTTKISGKGGAAPAPPTKRPTATVLVAP